LPASLTGIRLARPARCTDRAHLDQRQIGTRVAFDVEFDVWLVVLEHPRHIANVIGRDVPFVGARMDRDS
jgi:hypothetical protein